MEEVSLFLFVIILLLILSLRNNIKKQLNTLEEEIRKLREQLAKKSAENIAVRPFEPIITPYIEKPLPPAQETIIPIKQQEEKSLSEELNDLLEKEEEVVPLPIIEITEMMSAQPSPQAQSAQINSPVVEHEEPKPSFFERNPDLEKFIGENLVSKIGIAILVLAIGLFVKYAIDNDWIGAVGRVGIGILCGGILIAVAHHLRKGYKAFSSVLVGGGLAIFYFTITLAYHQFHLFTQTVAFVIMVVITAFAVILSNLYNRQELAIIALIGGFATPFMVSDGSGNYKALFSYLLILNSGLLVIAYNKAWRLLNFLAFLFTVVLFGSWLFTLETTVPASTYKNGLLFASAFYLLFFIINIAHNIKEKKKFIASDFGILLANTCAYFAAGLYLLAALKAGEYKGLFTASLGIFNLAASFVLLRNRKIDNNILYLLIGITLSFISLTAPIQLNGHNITLFWASECVLLYWLFLKSKIRIIRYASLIVWTAMIISLVLDWFNVYGISSLRLAVLTNKGFITTIFSAAACYLLFILRRAESPGDSGISAFYPNKNVFRIAGISLLFAAGFLEINHQFNHYYPGTNLYVVYLLLYTFAFVLVMTLINDRVKSLDFRWIIKACLFAICIVVYLISLPEIFRIQTQILEEQRLSAHFVAHWLAALMLGVIFYRLISMLRTRFSFNNTNSRLLTWVLCIVVVIYLSAEVHLLVNNLFYRNDNPLSNIQRVYVKTGLPILWGLCSFSFMWLGMKHKFRTLRIISLSIFMIILLKFFLFDIRNIPIAGKIAALFSLAVLLLVVSFMYQRLKKIIIDDEKRPGV